MDSTLTPNSYDIRDHQEHAEVMTLLSELPSEPQGREAYMHDAETIDLTHLVTDRAELIERLKAAFLASYRRWLESSSRLQR